MMRKITAMAASALAFLFVASGCSSSSSGPTDTSGTKQFQDLYTYDWNIGPGVETYYCGFRTLKSDLWISDFRPLLPPGTHHVTIGYQDPGTTPDGLISSDSTMDKAPCTGTTLGDELSYGATVGGQDFSLPAGVAVKIPAGKQLVFGLHVLNAGSTPLSGHSGVQSISPDPSKVTQEAEVVAAENFQLNIPPGRVTQYATCTMAGDVTIFALLHHMHQTGIHMTTTAGPADAGPDADITLLDGDYQFGDQHYVTLAKPIPLKKGEQLHVTCLYDNPGPATLTFGESTTKNEMCISFVYRYPAIEGLAPKAAGLPPLACVQ
jgi:hypothetical protein